MAVAGTRFGILAGYDGSPDADQALRWAAREVGARGVTLTVCHVCPSGSAAAMAADSGDGQGGRSGEDVRARGERHARDLIGSSADVRAVLAAEPPAAALCERSSGAEMTVVGSRGLGGFAGLVLGSVSSQVAEYGCGRIVVVRGQWRPVGAYLPGSIVVGGDGSADSAAAVGFAFEEAALRGAPLVAVCALADAAGSVGGARQVEDAFERVLSQCEKEDSDVVVHRRVSCGPPRSALMSTVADVQAQLLVVGARGRGGLPGMMLGSVSQAALRLAPCPVAVVHRR
jgi:nucleotide-binding universal stress UspA family protein